MLTELLDGEASGGSGQMQTGIISENMLDGYYRVTVLGQTYTARNQSGAALPIGSVVSVTTTAWGRFIVSSAARQAGEIPTIIIRG